MYVQAHTASWELVAGKDSICLTMEKPLG